MEGVLVPVKDSATRSSNNNSSSIWSGAVCTRCTGSQQRCATSCRTPPHILPMLLHLLILFPPLSSCLQLCVYAVFTALGVVSLWGQPWVLDTWQLWIDWPNQPFT